MNKYSIESKLQFIIYSILGIIIFFVPVTIGGKSTIPLDHIVTYILKIPYFQAGIWCFVCYSRGGLAVYQQDVE